MTRQSELSSTSPSTENSLRQRVALWSVADGVRLRGAPSGRCLNHGESMFAGLTRDLVSVDLAAVSRNHLRLSVATVLILLGFSPELLGGPEQSRAGFDVVAVYLLLLPAGVPVWSGLVLPNAIGAAGLAFRRLHRLSFDLSVAATALLLASVWVPQSEIDASWNFFMGANATVVGPEVELRAAGVLAALSSVLLSSVNVLTTVAYLRRSGLRWRDLDATVVAGLLRCVVAVVSAPVLIVGLVLLLVERNLGLGLFDNLRGGDMALFEQAFWFAMHPLLVTSLLPVIGTALVAAGDAGGAGRSLSTGALSAMIGIAAWSLVGWGQNLLAPSPLTATLFGVFGSLGAGALAGAAGQTLLRVARSQATAPRRWLAAASSMIVGLAAVRALLSAIPVISNATDIRLFGGAGLLTLVAAMCVGYATGFATWSLRRRSAPRLPAESAAAGA